MLPGTISASGREVTVGVSVASDGVVEGNVCPHKKMGGVKAALPMARANPMNIKNMGRNCLKFVM